MRVEVDVVVGWAVWECWARSDCVGAEVRRVERRRERWWVRVDTGAGVLAGVGGFWMRVGMGLE